LKHIGIKSLFLQELVKNKTVSLRKAKGDATTADILTKHVPEKVLTSLLALLPVSFDEPKTEDQNLSDNVWGAGSFSAEDQNLVRWRAGAGWFSFVV
jgi:hypothetical protein